MKAIKVNNFKLLIYKVSKENIWKVLNFILIWHWNWCYWILSLNLLTNKIKSFAYDNFSERSVLSWWPKRTKPSFPRWNMILGRGLLRFNKKVSIQIFEPKNDGRSQRTRKNNFPIQLGKVFSFSHYAVEAIHLIIEPAAAWLLVEAHRELSELKLVE